MSARMRPCISGGREGVNMECFRIDESGYTGFDLLNPQQRLQGAAALAISDEDAVRLITRNTFRATRPWS